MSFFLLQRGQIWFRHLKANINNTFLRAFLSLVAEFLSSIFSLPAIFPFHLISPSRFLGCSPLIVSLPLYSSYSSMFRLLPYLWTYFTLLSLVHSRSIVVIYIFFALRPLMYWRILLVFRSWTVTCHLSIWN